MPKTSTKSRRPQGRTVRFPGICEHAKALKCSRVTLYKMLAGYPGFVGLKGLRRRYEALLKKQGQKAG